MYYWYPLKKFKNMYSYAPVNPVPSWIDSWFHSHHIPYTLLALPHLPFLFSPSRQTFS
jgi:hypothetical protein